MNEQTASGEAPRKFRPLLVPTLIALVMLAILLGLGTWQVGRYREANQTIADYRAQHDELPPIESLGAFTGPDRVIKLQYRRVALKGRLIPEEAQILTAIYKFAKPGFGVLIPLEVAEGPFKKVTVYMGWVPRERLKEYLDRIKAAPETVIEGRIQHPGLFNAPKLEPIGEAEGLPKWRSPQIASILVHMAEHIEGVDPAVFIRSGKQASGETIDTELIPIDGYRHPLRLPPAKHIEYAVTWYGISVSLIAVWIALSFRRPREEDEQSAEA